ncbi:carboxypeptidase Y [Aspergillus luchuensis]|uniref:Carboxypeptidase Y n=1 Tax=Aspergillus kawachii TaxID=1069201 RepID=A0A146FAN0_ASPKA|nr:carboxypeptidase Y [Aspergillus luchuensis]
MEYNPQAARGCTYLSIRRGKLQFCADPVTSTSILQVVTGAGAGAGARSEIAPFWSGLV